jgi:hypothetical protein
MPPELLELCCPFQNDFIYAFVKKQIKIQPEQQNMFID